MLARVLLMHATMSDGINQVMLLGNLGADPELKQTSAGPVLKFNLATTRSWLDKQSNTEKKDTVWHRVTIFGRRGEALQKHLSKGSRVFVTGRIQTSSYEKDGQKRYSTDIICEDLKFAGGSDRAAGRPSASLSGMDDLPPMPPPSTNNGGYSHRPADSFEKLPF
jgi:single-strand DNA-binding protein